MNISASGSGALARRDAVLPGVLHGRIAVLLAHQLAVFGRRGHPVSLYVPARAGPAHEAHQARALVVGAARLERWHEAGGAELLQPPRVDVEVLERPLHLLAGHRLAFTEALLRD